MDVSISWGVWFGLLLLGPLPAQAGRPALQEPAKKASADAETSIGDLAGTHWVLYEIRDARGVAQPPFAAAEDGSRTILPIVFGEEVLAYATACKRVMAAFRQEPGRLIVGDAHASLGGCAESGVVAELSSRLHGMYRISSEAMAGGQQAMKLTASDGHQFLLYPNGMQAPISGLEDYLPPQVIYFKIGPDKLPCHEDPMLPGLDDSPPGECVAVRPASYAPDGRWIVSSTAQPGARISGLAPLPGVTSQVRVVRYELRYPEIHGPAYRDVLDLIIEQHGPGPDAASYRNPPNYWIP